MKLISGFKIEENLELRPFEFQNAGEIYETVRENYEHLRPFLYWVIPDYSLESAKEFIGQTQKSAAEKKSETFGIFLNNKLIGAISFVNFNWGNRRTEIGYWITKDFQGKGIITKSCKMLIDFAFAELEFNRIEIRCATENIRSCAVPERLGFKLDGILRQFQWRHTKFYDMAIYSILREEWENV